MTMINKKIVITAIVSIFGTALLVFVTLTHLAGSYVEDLSSQLSSSTLKDMDKEQSRLGVLCIDGDKAILKYIDAVAPISEKLKDGKRLLVTNSIFELGEKTSDVVNTCGLLKSRLEQNNNHTLSNLALGEDAVRQEFTIVRLSMARTTASWCAADCIRDAKKDIEENSLMLRKRLELKKPA